MSAKPKTVELGEYKGLEVSVDKTFDVSDIELKNELEAYRQQKTKIEVIKDAGVQLGDIANINYEGFKDGVKFEGGAGKNHPLEIGSGSFIPGFEEQIIGMNIQEEKDIEITFPANYHAKHLAGTAVTFKVTVNEITRKHIPALNDELAKNCSPFETLEELKEDIKNNLLLKKETESYNYKGELVVKKTVENASVEISEPMLEKEMKQMLSDLERSLKSQGITLETFLLMRRLTRKDLDAQFSFEAKKRVETQLVLGAIAKAEFLEVTEEDIDNEITFIADTYKKNPEELRSFLAQDGNKEALEKELAMRKAVEFLLENNTFK